MIENVKGSKARVSNEASAQRTDSLRESFKNLSSGLKISKAGEGEKGTNGASFQNTAITNFVKDLNDAVSFSSLALKSLEKVTQGTSSTNSGRLGDALTHELKKLRKDIGDSLEVLKKRAETAEIITENFSSAETRLEDVELAQVHAESTGLRIHTNLEQAVQAHGQISPDRVKELLAD